MIMCPGCYKPGKEGYCTDCRDRLFDGAKVPHKLPFDLSSTDKKSKRLPPVKQAAISGVQLKFSLQLKGNKLLPAEKEGQYILKTVPSLQIVEWDDAPENEHLTMQMASQLYGMRTADNALIYCKDGSLGYITRRFDIQSGGKKYLQEDMAQISGRSRAMHGEDYKYMGSYEEIGLLIRKYVKAFTPAIETFFQQVIFNYLFSNSDAHLKNFSLIRTEAGDYTLTPAYGLINAAPHMPGKAGLALPLYAGDKESSFYSSYGFYGRLEFMTLAQKIGVLPGRAEGIINKLLAPADQVIEMITQSLLQDVTKEKYILAFQDKLKRLKMIN